MQIKINSPIYNGLLANTAKRDVRYYLQGIYLSVESRELVATDGHSLLCVPIQDAELISCNDDDTSLIFCVEKPAYAGGYVEIDTDASEIRFHDSKGIERRIERIVPIDGKFPDYRRTFPENTHGVFNGITFNPELIARTTKALKHDGAVNLVHAGDGEPIRVELQGDYKGLTFVVMPCRW